MWKKVKKVVRKIRARSNPAAIVGGLRYMRAYRQQLTQTASSATYAPIAEEALDRTHLQVKAIAFYLPQFHPIPENDKWWGRGFTEWTNVSKAVPQFVGHYQPHLPDELGFYDLRLPEVQRRQMELAKQYGLHGFCFYHYWFAGRRLLDLPLRNWLASSELDFSFCLCWANENWTRRWDGLDDEILIGQKHSAEDDLAFIADVAPALQDPRYIRVNGKPLLIVYRVPSLPEPKATAERWRQFARANGIGDLYLVSAQTFGTTDPRPYGFDAAVQFPPHSVRLGQYDPIRKLEVLNPNFTGTVYRYADLVDAYVENSRPADYVLFRSVTPSWDNDARKPGRGYTFHDSTPEIYAGWLEKALRLTKQHNVPEERLVFINAWNEWGEGAHLEPDRKYGYAYLQATADALRKFSIEIEGDRLPMMSRGRPLVLKSMNDLAGQSTSKQEFLSDGSPAPSRWQVLSSEEHRFDGCLQRWLCYAGQHHGIAQTYEHSNYSTGAVDCVRLRDVLLIPQWGIVAVEDGTFLEESAKAASWFSPTFRDVPGVISQDEGLRFDLKTTTAIRTVEDAALLAGHWGAHNYGHWFMDCLPGIFLFRDEIRSGRIRLLSRPLAEWQKQTLELLSLDPSSVIEVDDSVVLCRDLICSSLLSMRGLMVPSSLVRDTVQAVASGAHLSGRDKGPPLIYVSRTEVKGKRRFINEGELIGSLKRLGFVAVNPERYSPREQIALFSNASVIIGPIGAALANIGFAPTGCTVIEILPENYVQFWIYHFAGLLGHRYAYIIADVTDAEEIDVGGLKRKDFIFDYKVDVERVVASAQAVLAS
jgi:capsular polysaccharide biosynthesis protein